MSEDKRPEPKPEFLHGGPEFAKEVGAGKEESSKPVPEPQIDEELPKVDAKPVEEDDGLEPEKVGEDSEPVLVRVAEWTEWIPGRIDENMKRENPDKNMIVYNGVSGLVTGKNEKLVSVEAFKLNQSRTIAREEEGELVTLRYQLYAFKAVLAENVSAGLITGIQESMLGPLHQEFEKEDEGKPESGQRDKRADLVVVERNRPEAVKGLGNRAQRRAKQKGKNK